MLPFLLYSGLSLQNFNFLQLIKIKQNWSVSKIHVLNVFVFFLPSLAGYVEAMASRLGLSIPDLTPKQADMWQTRLSAHLVSMCIYG